MPEAHNKVYDKYILFVRRNEDMEIREILKNIREKNNLTQEQMAVRVRSQGRRSAGGKQEKLNPIQIR